MPRDGQRAKLTRAALETLAVVAYRRPVTRARGSAGRGLTVALDQPTERAVIALHRLVAQY